MPGQPYISFYPGDWKKSVDVQSLPFHERGIWFEMLLLMHDSPQRGELSLPSGKPMADDEIARLLGLSPQAFANALVVMLRTGVTERNEDGALVCRRMVKERKKTEAKSAAGKLGADGKWSAKWMAELYHASVNDSDLWRSAGTEDQKRIKEACEQWQAYRQKRAEAPKDWRLYWEKQFKFLTQYTPRTAVHVIEESIRQNWQGLFPPKNHETNQRNHSTGPQRTTGADQRKVGIPAAKSSGKLSELLAERARKSTAHNVAAKTSPPERGQSGGSTHG